ncbi:hypothetical protein INT44_000049 [Umbelopsis vinacea]|uniref:CHCH domain-containing protein n=2 Tax=Umbelopsis TaxID=64561 RepID=A0A8H7PH82_9FUNG|nr:hypothetical protein INT44_000049 [Umbelopsis vinacea]
MPRQQRRSAPARAPAQQTRQAHTAPTRQAPPPQQQQHRAPPPQQTQQQQHAMTQPPPSAVGQPAQQGPGLFGQMASTAAGVAVGHSIGHAITGGASSLFGGSREQPPAEQPQSVPQQQYSDYQQPAYQQQSVGGASCEADAKAFTKCLEINNNDVAQCHWYLENLKACQQMSAQY